MQNLYTRMAGSAQRSIRKFGAMGAIRSQTPGSGPSYDPGPPTVTDHPAHIVLTDYSIRDIDGTRIKTADKRALVAPGTLPADPTTADKLVEADGTAWNIVAVEILRPAETILLYTCQVRK